MTENEAREALAKMYYTLFTGSPVLNHLMDTFAWPPISVPGDPFASHVRIGELNVMRHIQGMMAAGANPKLISPVMVE